MKVGIIGAGQLARMLSIAGTPLGIQISCIGNPGDSAEDVVHSLCAIDMTDTDALLRWATHCDVITFENENIDCAIIERINEVTAVYPSVQAIAMAQDRLTEKTILRNLGIQTAPFADVPTIDALKDAVDKYGMPAIIKHRRFGYDGKGQYLLQNIDDIPYIWKDLSKVCGGVIYERMIEFDLEVSQICSVARNGALALYPLTHTIHRNGILIESIAPYINERLQPQAHDIANTLVKHLGYVGTLAIECFVCDNHLIVNEIAPRVHNSGHWTIEGSVTSQFENHMRAVTGLALGATTSIETVMLNCIGSMPNMKDTAHLAYAKRHDYHKTARTGRKVGHITVNTHTEHGKHTLEQARVLVNECLAY